jgi:hypothetical protein
MNTPWPVLERTWSQAVTSLRQSALTRARVAWLVIGAGAVLRVAQYLSGRSLWLDEAMLALNIINRSFTGLLQPLDYHQGAPLGYLLLSKAATLVLGPNELALRLVALVASLLSLPLFYRLAQRFLAPNAALLALGLFTVLNPLIDFATEAKQYSSDVLVAIVLLLAATWYVRRERPTLRDNLALGVLGAAAIWFAHPAVFVLGGVGLTLLVLVARRRAWGELPALALCGALWTASLGVEYWISLRALGHDPALLAVWASGFMPIPPVNVSWFLRSFTDMFQYTVGLTDAGLGIGCLAFLVGIFYLWPGRPGDLGLLLAPLGVTLLASAAHVYPFAGRLLLFAVPAIVILIAAGLAYVYHRLRPARLAGVLLVGLLFFNPLYVSAYDLVHPRTKEEARTVLSALRREWQPGDVIYADNKSQFAYDFYAARLGLGRAPVTIGPDSNSWPTLLSDVDQERGKERVWFVFLHIQQPDQSVLVYLAYLDHLGRRVAAYRAPGSVVYLYDLAASAHS